MPQPWTATARNLPEHARNRIHTDAGAQAAGFPRALVAGVTTYAYLTHPLPAAWGLDWLAHGGGEVRFRRPVFDDDAVHCVPHVDGDVVVVDAVTPGPDQPRAVLRAWRHEDDRRPTGFDERDDGLPSGGEMLEPMRVELAGERGADYGLRAGDDLAVCLDAGVVHPAVWPAVANTVVHTQVARGSWIHIRSAIQHHATARAGSWADVEAVVVRRSTSTVGERAVLHVVISVDGHAVATLEHEAIVALP